MSGGHLCRRQKRRPSRQARQGDRLRWMRWNSRQVIILCSAHTINESPGRRPLRGALFSAKLACRFIRCFCQRQRFFPQKHSRLTRLKHIVILSVSSFHHPASSPAGCASMVQPPEICAPRMSGRNGVSRRRGDNYVARRHRICGAL